MCWDKQAYALTGMLISFLMRQHKAPRILELSVSVKRNPGLGDEIHRIKQWEATWLVQESAEDLCGLATWVMVLGNPYPLGEGQS